MGKLVMEFLAITVNDEGPLLYHADGTLLTMTKYPFWSVTSKALGALGLKSMKFGIHLFHIGAVSTAAAIRYPTVRIQKKERWRLAGFRRYVSQVQN